MAGDIWNSTDIFFCSQNWCLSYGWKKFQATPTNQDLGPPWSSDILKRTPTQSFLCESAKLWVCCILKNVSHDGQCFVFSSVEVDRRRYIFNLSKFLDRSAGWTGLDNCKNSKIYCKLHFITRRCPRRRRRTAAHPDITRLIHRYNLMLNPWSTLVG